jgi:hypothetical protein
MIERLDVCLAFTADLFILFDTRPAVRTKKDHALPPSISSNRSKPDTAWNVLSINGKLIGALPNPPPLVWQLRIYFRQR